MKKVFASLLLVTMVAGAGQAHAWFWNKNETTETRTTTRVEQDVTYRNTAPSSDNQKWVYNGNNGYKSIAGQVAREDRLDDGDNAAFTVHRTHATRFNASLRQGDTGQSMQTRVNHSFNN